MLYNLLLFIWLGLAESKTFTAVLHSSISIPCQENSTEKYDKKVAAGLWKYRPSKNGAASVDGSWTIKSVKFDDTGEYRCQLPDERRYNHVLIVFEQTVLDQRLLVNYRLAKQCDLRLDTQLLNDVTSLLCQADAKDKNGKCAFKKITASCIRPHPEDGKSHSDEELDYPWRFSIKAGINVQPLSKAEMLNCSYDFDCIFLKRVASKQSIFDNGRKRLQYAENRWFSEHNDRSQTYKRDMKSRAAGSKGAVCKDPRTYPHMATACILCGPNAVKANPTDTKCTRCEPPETYQVLYGQTKCNDCPISEKDLANTAFKDACEEKEDTTLATTASAEDEDANEEAQGFMAESNAGQELANMTNKLKDVSKDVVNQVRGMSKRNAAITGGVFLVLLVIVACVVFCRGGVGEGDRDELMAVVRGEDEEEGNDYGSKGSSRKKRDKGEKKGEKGGEEKSDKRSHDKKRHEKRKKEGKEKRNKEKGKDRDKDRKKKRKHDNDRDKKR